ncbi:MAG: hypothetical protein K0S38_493 [Candidatus Paceibacter sp.]|jgi:hypothetical protein|nr:hypothetical protein [Candidatus Paceibacter sp.]
MSDYQEGYEDGLNEGNVGFFGIVVNGGRSEEYFSGREAGAREKERREYEESQREEAREDRHEYDDSDRDYESSRSSSRSSYSHITVPSKPLWYRVTYAVVAVLCVLLAVFLIGGVTISTLNELTRSGTSKPLNPSPEPQHQQTYTPPQEIPYEERIHPPERRGWVWEHVSDYVPENTSVIIWRGNNAYLKWIANNVSYYANTKFVDQSRYEFRFSSSNGYYSITELSNITENHVDRNVRKNLEPGKVYEVTPGTEVFIIHPVNERMSFMTWWQPK